MARNEPGPPNVRIRYLKPWEGRTVGCTEWQTPDVAKSLIGDKIGEDAGAPDGTDSVVFVAPEPVQEPKAKAEPKAKPDEKKEPKATKRTSASRK